MTLLSTLHSASQLVRETVPLMPQEILELARQLTDQTQQLLADFGYYGLLVLCLTAALFLLIGSLLLVKHTPLLKKTQPESRVARPMINRRRLKRPVENRIAKANRVDLQSVSARIQAGQLSN